MSKYPMPALTFLNRTITSRRPGWPYRSEECSWVLRRSPDGRTTRWPRKGKSTGHQTGVVHRSSAGGHGVGEAENHNKGNDVDGGKDIEDVADASHPEVARLEGRAAGEDMRKDGGEVGKRGQLHETADEGIESGGGSDVNTSQDGNNHTTDQGCVERVVHPGIDTSQPAGEGGRFITRNGPQGTTSGDVATGTCDDSGQEGNDQQSKGATPSTRGLAVDLGERETVGIAHDQVEVIDGIEDRDHIEKTGDEADRHLSKDGLRDVAAGPIAPG